jgi:tRNA acetyltransferase TAN1
MPGDSGIFATCNKGREAKCVGELRDLFAEYATQLYGDSADNDDDDNHNDGGATSIENDIQAELAGIQKPATAQLFVPVKLDVQCGEFLKKKRKEKNKMGIPPNHAHNPVIFASSCHV